MNESEEPIQLHALVSGRVQGVGFRQFVATQAQALKLDGWVRNLWDGRVEVLAEGARAEVETLLRYIQRGPSMARVEAVDVQWSKAAGGLRGFHTRFSE